MISKFLKVGDRIEMKRYSLGDDSEPDKRTYVSQLLDILDEYNISIAVPIEGSHLVPLEVYGRFEIRFITSSGVYMCRGEITRRYKQNNIYFLEVKILSDLKKDQRRQYFRLEKIVPLEYHRLTERELTINERLKNQQYKNDAERRDLLDELKSLATGYIEGTMSNISGGGIKFSSNEGLERDEIIRIRICLPETHTVDFDILARIVASQNVNNRNMKFEHRAEFTDINRDTREDIIRYVFSEERKQRQKETGSY